MGSWESEVIACFWKGNFVSRFLLTAERRECKESYTLRKRTLHPLLSSGWLDSNIHFGRYPIPSGNRLFKYLVSLWWSELWRGSELGQTQSFIAKGEQHTTQRVEVSSWEKSVSTETLRHWQILCSSTRPRIQENHFPFAMFQHFTFSCWLEIFSSRFHLNNCRYIQPLPTDYCHNNGCQPGLQVLMLHPAGRSSTTSLNLSPECQHNNHRAQRSPVDHQSQNKNEKVLDLRGLICRYHTHAHGWHIHTSTYMHTLQHMNSSVEHIYKPLNLTLQRKEGLYQAWLLNTILRSIHFFQW